MTPLTPKQLQEARARCIALVVHLIDEQRTDEGVPEANLFMKVVEIAIEDATYCGPLFERFMRRWEARKTLLECENFALYFQVLGISKTWVRRLLRVLFRHVCPVNLQTMRLANKLARGGGGGALRVVARA